MTVEHDVVVVGGGPGGYAAALSARSAGLTVALVEADKLGGTCLHRGCIPAKSLLETASVARTVGGAEVFGVRARSDGTDWDRAQARKGGIVDANWRGLQSMLRRRGVDVFVGYGSLEAPGRVRVATDGDALTLHAGAVILATGSAPRAVAGLEPDGERIMTSDHFLEIEDLPPRVAILGGGAIGCEFASLCVDLGCDVTLLEACDSLLPGCDTDISAVVERSFRSRGVDVRTSASVVDHESVPDGVRIVLDDESTVEADLVLLCVGRRPRSEGLGLESVGVSVDPSGHVGADERCRTSVPGVYAVGDLLATPALAHVAFAEAMVAVRDVLGEHPEPVDHDRVPWCVYSEPEVAFAGLSEQEARARGLDVVTATTPLGHNARSMILGDGDGLVKVVAEATEDGSAGFVLGVHMVGPWVTEQLVGGYLAVNWDAVVDDVASFVAPHPTVSEAMGEAFLALAGRPLHG